MFLVEIGAGLAAGSASLQADALDFFGDAANYAISLMVVGMALRYRATAALAKGATMSLFGVWIIGTVVWHAMQGTLPSALTIGAVGFAALVANVASFGLLWAYRSGDANMRSAWICTRNDVLGNFAVLLAAFRRVRHRNRLARYYRSGNHGNARIARHGCRGSGNRLLSYASQSRFLRNSALLPPKRILRRPRSPTCRT